MQKNNLLRDFGRHINYAVDKFPSKFKPELNNIKLTAYQEFAASMFLLEDFTKMLLFWETGFGKTIFCTYIIKNLFNIYPQWRIFIFVKSSLRNDPWIKTTTAFLPENIRFYIDFVHYDNPRSVNYLILKLKSIEPRQRAFFIFDESHDFIKKIVPKDDSIQQRNLEPMCEPLLKHINKGFNKTLFMSATPIVDSHKEFLYMCRFLRTGRLKLDQILFDKDSNLIEPALLKKVCIGLCSYQRRSEPDVFKDVAISETTAGKRVFIHDIYMSEEQSSLYRQAAAIEAKSRAAGFRTRRKLVNTFAYQEVKVKGDEGDDEYENLIKERFNDFQDTLSKITFTDSFIENFKTSNLRVNKESALSKNINCLVREHVSFMSSMGSKKKKRPEMDKLETLHSFSSKYIKTAQLILKSRGKCLVYQPFVSFEGVRTFLLYLEKFNISYIEYTQRTRTTRSDLIKDFNSPENKFGDKIKCCVLSGAGSEGISMTNISDMVIMDIPWSGSHLEQILGRGIRLNSHIELPLEERFVNVHILVNHTSDEPSLSVDKELLTMLQNKEKKKLQLVKILEDSSIESIHDRYKDEQAVEKTNFYPFFNIDYDVVKMRKEIVSVLKELIKINITFDPEFKTVKEALLEDSSDRVFMTGEHIANLVLKDKKRVFKVVDNKLVYLVNSC